MKYRLQVRGLIGGKMTPWKTIYRESADEHGGARAEKWLLKAPFMKGVEKRIRLGKDYILTREQRLAEENNLLH